MSCFIMYIRRYFYTYELIHIPYFTNVFFVVDAFLRKDRKKRKKVLLLLLLSGEGSSKFVYIAEN